MKKICFIVSSPGSAISFLKDPIYKLSNSYDIYIVANLDNESQLSSLKIREAKNIKIIRNICLYRDFKAFVSLFIYFRKMKFSVVHSVTPKAGLLTALAGFFARVPNRVHIFTGQVWATRTGLMRSMLRMMDKLIALLDTNLLVDGEGQRRFLIEQGVLNHNNSSVLASGSICGVNLERFSPNPEIRLAVRKELSIPDGSIVFVFLGRLCIDKGIRELLNAFAKLADTYENVFLLLVGRDEGNCVSMVEDMPSLKPGVNLMFYGQTPFPERLLKAGDVFCLPTYREGFPSSVIQASCLGLPVICSDVYGVSDAMIDEVTGIRCHVKDVQSLYIAMMRLYSDPELRIKLGSNGRQRVLDYFSSNIVTNEWISFYKSLLNKS